MDDALIYLAWYLAIGSAIFAAMFVLHQFAEKNEWQLLSDGVDERLDFIFPERKKFWHRILNNIVAPSLVFLLLVANGHRLTVDLADLYATRS